MSRGLGVLQREILASLEPARAAQPSYDRGWVLYRRVEVRCLPGDHMLDTPIPNERGPGRLGTRLHHKRPMGRERQLGHRWPPVTPRPGGAWAHCLWHVREGVFERTDGRRSHPCGGLHHGPLYILPYTGSTRAAQRREDMLSLPI